MLCFLRPGNNYLFCPFALNLGITAVYPLPFYDLVRTHPIVIFVVMSQADAGVTSYDAAGILDHLVLAVFAPFPVDTVGHLPLSPYSM